jgi:rod shape determining protein RodA
MNRILGRLGRMDYLIFTAGLLLSAVGIAAIGSVGLAASGAGLSVVAKQTTALLLGIAAALILTALNYRALDHYARIIYLASLLGLIAVLFFGATVNGTKGWFVVAGWGFQPVEFAKLALVLLLARFMSQHKDVSDLKVLANSFFLAALPAGLTILQPDFGGAVTILAVWFLLMFVAGVRRRHLLALAVSALAIGLVGWFLFLQDYQKERVLTFIDPGRAPLTRGYNITQAKIAIGSGGLFGRGLGYGSQSQLRFLPEAQTDFIFAVIAEELGFVAVLAIFLLFLAIFRRALALASRSPDNFALFLALGLALNLFVGFTINVGMNLGLMPVTGIALPFLSAGGSSLLASWIIIGLIQSVAARSEGFNDLTLREEAAGLLVKLDNA